MSAVSIFALYITLASVFLTNSIKSLNYWNLAIGTGSQDLLSNISYEEQKSDIDIELEDWNIAFNTLYVEYSIPRDLNGFTVYRDNNEIASTNSETYSYLDLGLDNGTQYCYYVVANYDEGDSQPTDTV